MATIKALQKTLNTLVENQVTRDYFTNEIEKLNDRLDQQDKDMVDVKKRLKKVESFSKTIPTDIYAEINEQESRKRNVIIFGLDEQKHGSQKEKFEKERRKVMKLLSDMELSNNEMKMRLQRLGKANENKQSNSKPRPLKLIMQNNNMKDKVFAHAKNLKDKHEWKGIAIGPDLTKTQQTIALSQRKELLDLANQKNGELTEEEIDNGIEYKVVGHYGHGNLRMIKTFQYYTEPREEEEEIG